MSFLSKNRQRNHKKVSFTSVALGIRSSVDDSQRFGGLGGDQR